MVVYALEPQVVPGNSAPSWYTGWCLVGQMGVLLPQTTKTWKYALQVVDKELADNICKNLNVIRKNPIKFFVVEHENVEPKS